MTYTTSNASRATGIVTLVLIGAWLVIGAAIAAPFLPALAGLVK